MFKKLVQVNFFTWRRFVGGSSASDLRRGRLRGRLRKICRKLRSKFVYAKLLVLHAAHHRKSAQNVRKFVADLNINSDNLMQIPQEGWFCRHDQPLEWLIERDWWVQTHWEDGDSREVYRQLLRSPILRDMESTARMYPGARAMVVHRPGTRAGSA